MSAFTFRIGHLENIPDFKVGDLVTEGNCIGRMGSTGQSKHNHVHADCIHGHVNKIVRLKEISDDKEESDRKYKANRQQTEYFIDEAFFKIQPVITTPYLSEKYEELFGKKHPAIDLVPADRHVSKDHFNIYWNRSKTGHVLATGFDKGGYGNYILIGFET